MWGLDIFVLHILSFVLTRSRSWEPGWSFWALLCELLGGTGAQSRGDPAEHWACRIGSGRLSRSLGNRHCTRLVGALCCFLQPSQVAPPQLGLRPHFHALPSGTRGAFDLCLGCSVLSWVRAQSFLGLLDSQPSSPGPLPAPWPGKRLGAVTRRSPSCIPVSSGPPFIMPNARLDSCFHIFCPVFSLFKPE